MLIVNFYKKYWNSANIFNRTILGITVILIPVLFMFAYLRLSEGALFLVITNLLCCATMVVIHLLMLVGKTVLAKDVLLGILSFIGVAIIAVKGLQQLPWVYPIITAIFFLMKPKQAIIFNLIFISLIVAILFFKTTTILWLASVFSLLFTLSTVAIFAYEAYVRHEELKSKNELLEIESRTDRLTDLYNRRVFEKYLEIYSSDNMYDYGLILVDLDNFKNINDNYGHPVGDVVLKKTAICLKSISREDTVLCRIGGEEFALLFKTDDIEMTRNLAQRILYQIRDFYITELSSSEDLDKVDGYIKRGQVTENEMKSGICIPFSGFEHITASIGYQNKGILRADAWFKRTDEGLYKAKSTGKNKISTAVDDIDELKMFELSKVKNNRKSIWKRLGN